MLPLSDDVALVARYGGRQTQLKARMSSANEGHRAEMVGRAKYPREQSTLREDARGHFGPSELTGRSVREPISVKLVP